MPDERRRHIADLRERASFYELEARYAAPVLAQEELAKAGRLRRLSERLENVGKVDTPS